MALKKELSALKKDIKAIGNKLEKLIAAIEKVETKAPKAPKARTVKASNDKAPAKQKAIKATATDQVLNIINGSEKGVDTSTLMKKTGFNQKKITNILHRSFKAGRIKRAEKGIYVGVKKD